MQQDINISHLNTISGMATITLSQLQVKLESSPIFIGENHANPFAREAIKELIRTGVVRKLFLELPVEEEDLTLKYMSLVPRIKDEERNTVSVKVVKWLENISRRNNPFPLADLVSIILEGTTISIYFHDTPMNSMGESFINGEYKHPSYAVSPEGLKERNKYSAQIIKSNSPGPGTIILAGQDHLDPQKIGEENTLQALLGYGNDSVFDLSTLTKALR